MMTMFKEGADQGELGGLGSSFCFWVSILCLCCFVVMSFVERFYVSFVWTEVFVSYLACGWLLN